MSVPAGEFDSVILAGGNAVRLGGADKPGLTVGDTPMVVLVARAAAAAGSQRLIVVGPPRGGAVGAGLSAAGAIVVREEPPGGGPVPALRRGLAEVTAPWLLVLAADLPFLTGEQLTGLLAQGSGSRCPQRGRGPDGRRRQAPVAGRRWRADLPARCAGGLPGQFPARAAPAAAAGSGAAGRRPRPGRRGVTVICLLTWPPRGRPGSVPAAVRAVQACEGIPTGTEKHDHPRRLGLGGLR